MKKIMFNDDFGLTQSVLDGNKKHTRRIPNISETDIKYLDSSFDWDLRESVIIERYSKYKVGEVVAIAQSYKQCDKGQRNTKNKSYLEYLDSTLAQMTKLAGWNNKMFVKADLMPHQIKITKISIEKLQDISDEDCLKEGVFKGMVGNAQTNHWMDAYYTHKSSIEPCCTPRGAFALLIDKVSGKGTWESNPYVFVYEFELIK